VVKLLLGMEAEVNSKNDEGYTALYIAAEAGHGPVVQLLLEKGVEINSKDDKGYAALRMTAW
jgi:ankyrin repeat protein